MSRPAHEASTQCSPQVVGNIFCCLRRGLGLEWGVGKPKDGSLSLGQLISEQLCHPLLSGKERGRRGTQSMGEKKAFKNITKRSGVKDPRGQKASPPPHSKGPLTTKPLKQRQEVLAPSATSVFKALTVLRAGKKWLRMQRWNF